MLLFTASNFIEMLEQFINYSCYNSYRMTTTIQISEETKQLIGTFGTKGDTYEVILQRMYRMAVKEQLQEFLLSAENSFPIDEAIARAKKRWRK